MGDLLEELQKGFAKMQMDLEKCMRHIDRIIERTEHTDELMANMQDAIKDIKEELRKEREAEKDEEELKSRKVEIDEKSEEGSVIRPSLEAVHCDNKPEEMKRDGEAERKPKTNEISKPMKLLHVGGSSILTENPVSFVVSVLNNFPDLPFNIEQAKTMGWMKGYAQERIRVICWRKEREKILSIEEDLGVGKDEKSITWVLDRVGKIKWGRRPLANWPDKSFGLYCKRMAQHNTQPNFSKCTHYTEVAISLDPDGYSQVVKHKLIETHRTVNERVSSFFSSAASSLEESREVCSYLVEQLHQAKQPPPISYPINLIPQASLFVRFNLSGAKFCIGKENKRLSVNNEEIKGGKVGASEFFFASSEGVSFHTDLFMELNFSFHVLPLRFYTE